MKQHVKVLLVQLHQCMHGNTRWGDRRGLPQPYKPSQQIITMSQHGFLYRVSNIEIPSFNNFGLDLDSITKGITENGSPQYNGRGGRPL